MQEFSIKKLINGVVVIPDDTREWVKYGVAIVVAFLARQGYAELGGLELVVIGGLVKTIADSLHYWLKN